MRESVSARAPKVKIFILEKGKRSGHLPGIDGNDDRLAAQFAARLKLPFENHKHRISRIARIHQAYRRP